jgi:hypothetical protein
MVIDESLNAPHFLHAAHEESTKIKKSLDNLIIVRKIIFGPTPVTQERVDGV